MINTFIQTSFSPLTFGIGSLLLIAGAGFGSAGAIEIERLDPALDGIVPGGAKVDRIAEGFKWPEGPIWVHSGYLLLPRSPAIRSGSGRLTGRCPFYAAERLLWTGAVPRAGTRIKRDDPRQSGLAYGGGTCRPQRISFRVTEKGRHQTVLAERYQGKRLNSPNDLVYHSDGSLTLPIPLTGFRARVTPIRKRNCRSMESFAFQNATSHPVARRPMIRSYS
jgi:hypothetical protein